MIEEIEPTSWVSASWGAGQGITHEIKRWRDSGGGYIARVSVADIIAPGPFTALPGYHRWLTVLDDGGGFELTIGQRNWRGVFGESVTFDAALPVHATISGPARVWNLIVREHVPWSALWHRWPSKFVLPPGVGVVHEIASGRTRIGTSIGPIELAVDEAPAIVVHLGLGC